MIHETGDPFVIIISDDIFVVGVIYAPPKTKESKFSKRIGSNSIAQCPLETCDAFFHYVLDTFQNLPPVIFTFPLYLEIWVLKYVRYKILRSSFMHF